MKSIIVKSIFLLLLSFGIYSTSSARGYNYYHGRYYAPRGYYGPRVYCGPHYYGPGAYYAPVFIPGRWVVNRFGARVWVR
jgi:hypothetical protein